MKSDFTPVYPHFYEIFFNAQKKETSRVIYFGEGIELLEVQSKLLELWKNDSNEEFLVFSSGEKVRIDRIISINGIPGPAFDEYDRYATACLDCNVQ